MTDLPHEGLLEEAVAVRLRLAQALTTQPIGHELLLLLAAAGKSSAKMANVLQAEAASHAALKAAVIGLAGELEAEAIDAGERARREDLGDWFLGRQGGRQGAYSDAVNRLRLLAGGG